MEIVARQFHFLTPEECIELLVNKIDVERMQTFVVEVAILVAWRTVAVDEIVVKRDGNGTDFIDGELHGESFACGCLAARRRSGDEHHAYFRPFGYHVGNARDLLLLKGLTYVDDMAGIAFLNGCIELANRTYSKNILPAMVLLEDFEHLVLPGHLAKHRRILARRNAQQQSIIVELQTEEFHLSRRREQ